MKAHFVDSSDPLASGRDYVSRCGQEVKKAEWAAFFDNQLINGKETLAVFDFKGICGKCVRSVLEFGAARYLYAGIDGQAFRNAEE
jgi:hypothetical protein